GPAGVRVRRARVGLTLTPSTLTPSTLTPSTLTPSTLTPSTLTPSTLTPLTLTPGARGSTRLEPQGPYQLHQRPDGRQQIARAVHDGELRDRGRRRDDAGDHARPREREQSFRHRGDADPRRDEADDGGRL